MSSSSLSSSSTSTACMLTCQVCSKSEEVVNTRLHKLHYRECMNEACGKVTLHDACHHRCGYCCVCMTKLATSTSTADQMRYAEYSSTIYSIRRSQGMIDRHFNAIMDACPTITAHRVSVLLSIQHVAARRRMTALHQQPVSPPSSPPPPAYSPVVAACTTTTTAITTLADVAAATPPHTPTIASVFPDVPTPPALFSDSSIALLSVASTHTTTPAPPPPAVNVAPAPAITATAAQQSDSNAIVVEDNNKWQVPEGPRPAYSRDLMHLTRLSETQTTQLHDVTAQCLLIGLWHGQIASHCGLWFSPAFAHYVDSVLARMTTHKTSVEYRVVGTYIQRMAVVSYAEVARLTSLPPYISEQQVFDILHLYLVTHREQYRIQYPAAAPFITPYKLLTVDIRRKYADAVLQHHNNKLKVSTSSSSPSSSSSVPVVATTTTTKIPVLPVLVSSSSVPVSSSSSAVPLKPFVSNPRDMREKKRRCMDTCNETLVACTNITRELGTTVTALWNKLDSNSVVTVESETLVNALRAQQDDLVTLAKRIKAIHPL